MLARLLCPVLVLPALAQQFSPAPAHPLTLPTASGLAAADLDGDGDPDLVLASYYSASRMWLNLGQGDFVEVTATHLPAPTAAVDVIAVDVDADGDQDLVFGRLPGIFGTGSPVMLLRNDGTGHFAIDAAAIQMQLYATDALAAFDADGDGDPDLLVGGAPGARLLLNDGRGTFIDVTATHLPASTLRYMSVATADVEGDGDLDALLLDFAFGNPQTSSLLRNNGAGVFTVGQTFPGTGEDWWSALVDVDGDGDPDLIRTRTGSQPPRLDLNQGGTFTAVPLAFGPGSISGFATRADIEDDGDVDVIMVDGIYLNSGSGTFTFVTNRHASTNQFNWFAPHLVAIDVDDDTDLDVIGAGVAVAAANSLFVNRLRHVELPQPPRVGQLLRIALHACPGCAPAPAIGIAALAFGPASLPTPFGNLHLDPASLIALPWATIPAPAGVTEVTLAIPNDPAFAVPISVQALIVEANGRARFSNTLGTTILP